MSAVAYKRMTYRKDPASLVGQAQRGLVQLEASKARYSQARYEHLRKVVTDFISIQSALIVEPSEEGCHDRH